MQLTAARLRHHWHLSSIAAPQMGVHRRVPDSKMQEHNQPIFSGGKIMLLVAVPNKYIRLCKFWTFVQLILKKLTFQPCVE